MKIIQDAAKYMIKVSEDDKLFASYFWWRDYYKEEFCDHRHICHKKSYQQANSHKKNHYYFLFYVSRPIVIFVQTFIKHQQNLHFIATSKIGGLMTKYANTSLKMRLK